MANFTDDLGFTLQEDNENPDAWGQVLNSGVIKLLEESQVGGSSKSIIDVTPSTNINLVILDGVESDVVATGTNKARCGILKLTGTLSNDIDLIVPTINNRYILIGTDFADGGFTITVKTSNSTNTIDITSGDVAFFVTDPTELYPIIQTGGGGGSSLLAINNLSDVANAKQSIDNLGIYPIGSIYFTTTAANPDAYLPGSWQAAAEGRVIVGVGTGTDDNAENRAFTGGELGGEYNHALTIPELPSHNHDTIVGRTSASGTTGGTLAVRGNGADRFITTTPEGLTGSDTPHTNVQPYLGVYIWERIA
jgi:hypothetical protein